METEAIVRIKNEIARIKFDTKKQLKELEDKLVKEEDIFFVKMQKEVQKLNAEAGTDLLLKRN